VWFTLPFLGRETFGKPPNFPIESPSLLVTRFTDVLNFFQQFSFTFYQRLTFKPTVSSITSPEFGLIYSLFGPIDPLFGPFDPLFGPIYPLFGPIDPIFEPLDPYLSLLNPIWAY
jgi:hypothetical protein